MSLLAEKCRCCTAVHAYNRGAFSPKLVSERHYFIVWIITIRLNVVRGGQKGDVWVDPGLVGVGIIAAWLRGSAAGDQGKDHQQANQAEHDLVGLFQVQVWNHRTLLV